jgi:hypothetical protein
MRGVKPEHRTLVFVWVSVGVTLLVGLVVLGVWWARMTMTKAKDAALEGMKFAATHDADACVDQALRYLYGPGVSSEASLRAFLHTCLANAPRSPTFCADLPARGDIMKGVAFGMRQCSKRGFIADERCSRSLAEAIPDACAAAGPTPRAAP